MVCSPSTELSCGVDMQFCIARHFLDLAHLEGKRVLLTQQLGMIAVTT